MFAEVFSVLAVVLWIVAVPRLRDLAPSATASRRSVAAAITALPLTATAFSPGAGWLLYELSGVAHLDELLGRAALMTAAVAAQCIFLTLGHDEGRRPRHTAVDDRPRPAPSRTSALIVRHRLYVLIAALALLTAVFTVTAVTVHPAPGADYLREESDEASVAVYVATFTSLLGWCFLDLLFAWRRLRHQVNGPLRTGLGLIAAAAACGLGYVISRTIGQVAGLTDSPGLVDLALVACISTGSATALLAAAGISWHRIHTCAVAMQTWRRTRRRLILLGPLWRDLVTSTPDIALQPPGRWCVLTDRTRVRDLSWQVYRRVIEIHDGAHALGTPLAQGEPAASTTSPRGGETLLGAAARSVRHLGPASRGAAAAPVDATVEVDQDRQIARVVDVAHRYARRNLTAPTAVGSPTS